MPSIFVFLGYHFFFWSNEGNPLEPVHIHFSKGSPTSHAPKAYIKKDGSVCFVVDTVKNISKSELKKIEEIISENKDSILDEWYKRFGKITYYEEG